MKKWFWEIICGDFIVCLLFWSLGLGIRVLEVLEVLLVLGLVLGFLFVYFGELWFCIDYDRICREIVKSCVVNISNLGEGFRVFVGVWEVFCVCVFSCEFFLWIWYFCVMFILLVWNFVLNKVLYFLFFFLIFLFFIMLLIC